MTAILWEHLHPATQALLRARLYHQVDKGRLDCGCYKQPSGSWRLCAYHEGFDDGAEAASAT